MKKKKKYKRKPDESSKSPYTGGIERPKPQFRKRVGQDAFGVKVDL
jgi:hypothetical protein